MEGLVETGLEVAGKLAVASAVAGLSIFGMKKSTKYVGETGESFMEKVHSLKEKTFDKRDTRVSEAKKKENEALQAEWDAKVKISELEAEKLRLQLELAKLNAQPTAVQTEAPKQEEKTVETKTETEQK